MVEDRQVVTASQDGDIAVLTLDSPPVNALGLNLRRQIVSAIQKADADPATKAIVLIGAGRGFSGGADITEFTKAPVAPTLHDMFDVIEGASKPVVVAIHGTTLGGGLETALACHYRVAVPSAKVGLPEVKLGILPGGGGTQRLPRLIGVEAALEAITSGTPFSAKAAKALGVIDEIVDENDLRGGAVAFAKKVVADGAKLRKVRDLDDKIAPARGKPEIFADFAKANARKFRGFEAPAKCIEAIKGAVDLPFDEGEKNERRLFVELLSGQQSAAQRHAFFAERQAGKVADVPETTETLPIKRVGIIGAGTMGGGIAMNFLNAGIPVTMVEMKADALERGQKIIRKNYEATAKKGRLKAEDVETRMGLLTGVLELEKLADCDLIIEAVFELMEVKKDVFGKLDKIAKKGAILASNTSYLDINEIADSTSRPESVIGMHFFSPANVMRLLEVVRGEKTAKPVIATAMQLAKKIGKVGVLVGVSHGFVGNRMLESSPARGQQADHRGCDAVGRRPRALRFRPADGPFRDGRPRGARPRLGQGAFVLLDDPRDPLRDGPARPEERQGLLRLRRDPQGEPLARGRKGHPRFLRQAGGHAPYDLGRRDPGALPLPDDQRGREDPRREDRGARVGHRCRVDDRLRLAGLSRRPDALRGRGRPRPRARSG